MGLPLDWEIPQVAGNLVSRLLGSAKALFTGGWQSGTDYPVEILQQYHADFSYTLADGKAVNVAGFASKTL